MKFMSIVSLLVLSFAANSWAEESALVVEQYDLLRERATLKIETPTDIPMGTLLRVHGKNGSCMFRVTDRINDQLIAQVSQCGTEIVRPGMRLAYSSGQPTASVPSWPSEGRFPAGQNDITVVDNNSYMDYIKNRISVFLGYNFSSNLEGKIHADGSLKDLSGNSAFSMGLLGKVYEFNSQVSLNVGLGHEFNRTFDEGTYIVNNAESTTQITGGFPELSIWTVYVQAETQLLEKLTAFGGLNLSLPSLKRRPWDADGDIGFQAGASYEVLPQLMVDGLIKITNMNFTNEFGETTDVSLSGLEFRGRYTFLIDVNRHHDPRWPWILVATIILHFTVFMGARMSDPDSIKPIY